MKLIFKTTHNEKIPNNIINKYKENINIRDLDFIFFEDRSEVAFLNSFWFVINYDDIIDFNKSEIANYYLKDLYKLQNMRVEYDKHKFLPEEIQYTNLLELFLDMER